MKTFLTFLLSLSVLGSSYAADSSKTVVLNDALDATLAAFTNSLTVLTVGTLNAATFNAAEVNTPLLNATNLSTPLITNVFGILQAIQTPPITVSNVLVSFATNSYEFYGTNFIGTNIVKLPTGVRGKATIIIRPWAVATPTLLPSFGSGASGIFWHTNGLPDAYFKMLTEGAPPGTNTVIEIEQWDTNSYPGFTQWRHP